MSRTIFTLFLLGLSHLSSAQMSMNEFLLGSFDVTQIESLKEQRLFIDDNGFKSPILREVEFRMRSNRFENGLTDYRLRFSPINPWEKAANNRYREALEEELAINLKFTLNEVLRVRYQLVIRYLNYLELKRIEELNLAFYNNLLQLVSSQPGSFDARDIIDLDKALLKSELTIKEIVAELALMNKTIDPSSTANTVLTINREMLITLSQISEWMEAMGVSSIMDENLELLLNSKEVATGEANQKIEENQAFNNIGYVQAEYRVDEGRSFGENIGMQLAVVIPVTNPDKPDLERRRLRLLKDLQELEEDKEELTLVILGTQISLSKTIEQYNLVNQKLIKYQDFNASTIGANSDIELTIELQEMRSYLASEELNLYCDALNLFVDQLANSGELVATPYVNLLSKAKEELEIEE